MTLCFLVACTLAEWVRCGLKFSATEDCCKEATGTKETHYCWGDMRYHCDVGKYHGAKWKKFTDCCEDKDTSPRTCP